MADRPYSRVYYIDLERDYQEVWRDDALLSTYVRLLSIAEAMWPAIPEIPRSARSANVKRLVGASLVEMVPPFGFRIKGLETERNARSNAARNAAGARWNNAPAMPNRAEPNLTEPTRALPKKNGAPFTDPVLIAQRAAILERYGEDKPIVPTPTRALTPAEQEREARRVEAFALHQQFKMGVLDEAQYQRALADIGKQPDDLTRADS